MCTWIKLLVTYSVAVLITRAFSWVMRALRGNELSSHRLFLARYDRQAKLTCTGVDKVFQEGRKEGRKARRLRAKFTWA